VQVDGTVAKGSNPSSPASKYWSRLSPGNEVCAFGTGRSDRKDIFISNFAAFPTSAGAPGVLEMEVGIAGSPID